MVRKQTAILASVFVFCPHYSPALSAQDHGTTGVSPGAPVDNILQLTTDPIPAEDQMDYFTNSNGLLNVTPWKPDGTWLTFTSRFTSSDEIVKMQADGSSFTRLTDNSVEDSNASYSSDGKIYYTKSDWYLRRVSDNSPLTEEDINPDTSNGYSYIKPSPDGQKIVLLSSGDSRLYVADSDGSNKVAVSGTYNSTASYLSVDKGQYSWSPDSSQIVYRGYNLANHRLYIANADGTGNATDALPVFADASNPTAIHSWPVWSPDGNKIAFLWYPSTSRKLYYTTPNGATVQELDSINTGLNPGFTDIEGVFSWGPQSVRIAYSKMYYDSTAVSPDLTNTYNIFIVQANDSPSPVELTRGYTDHYPSFSPNGFQIAFQSNQEVWLSPPIKTREEQCSVSCTDYGDILLLNLNGDYGGPVPAVPGAPTASDQEFEDKVAVSWTGVQGATSYELWRSMSAPGSGEKLTTVSATNYDDTTAAGGAVYYYSVKACNATGCSDNSPQDMGSLYYVFPWPMFLPAISAQQ